MIDRCIMLIEEHDDARDHFVSALRHAYPNTTLAVCSGIEHARTWLRRHSVRCHFLCSGSDELHFLETIRPTGKAILHTAKESQNPATVDRLGQTGWKVYRCDHLRRGNDMQSMLENWSLFLYAACGEEADLAHRPKPIQ